MAFATDILHEISSFRRAYPPFVRGRTGPEQGDIPVFVFHTIEPDRFESQLQYLRQNGYRTLSLDEFVAIQEGRRQGTGREVLLTIDDARSSVWRFGFPLLRRYGAHAALFAITGWTASNGGLRPNSDDVRAGGRSLADIHALDPDDSQVCNWDELRSMQDSGLVDVECHTHLHQRLFARAQLVDVITSTSVRTASDAAYSPYLQVGMDPTRIAASSFEGSPLFPNVPLMAGEPALRIREEVAQEVRESWRSARQASDERDATRRTVEKFRPRIAAKDFTALDASQVSELIREDLAASQAALRSELKLPRSGVHLCLPFTIGGNVAVGVARSLGFKTVFFGVSRERNRNTVGSDLLAVVRVKNDFIWRLPGDGRRSLMGLYLEKAKRRLARITPY